jgi:hypothetical protein
MTAPGGDPNLIAPFDTHRLVPSNPDKQQRPIVPKPFFHGLGQKPSFKQKSKITGQKLNLIAGFFSPQIPSPHVAPPCDSTFAQTANRTETFHVKHFCPIGPCDRTNLMDK